MTSLLRAFVFALFATLGFCIIFHVPARHIPIASAIGGLGWTFYQMCLFFEASTVIACFFAACFVGLLSDLAARFFKDAATVFIIPGILCLVPGSGMYNTMAELVNGNLDAAASTCSQTVAMAGAIALGLLAVGAVTKIIVSIARRAVDIANKL